MNYKLRNAESNIKFDEFEYLQGGILYRFDFKQVEHTFEDETELMWHYQEIWLPKNADEDMLNEIIEIENLEGATAENLEEWKSETPKPE